ANSLWMLGKYDEAQAIVEELLYYNQRVFGLENEDTVLAMLDLGVILYQRGEWEKSEDMYKQALTYWPEKMARDRSYCLMSLGICLQQQDKLEASRQMLS